MQSPIAQLVAHAAAVPSEVVPERSPRCATPKPAA